MNNETKTGVKLAPGGKLTGNWDAFYAGKRIGTYSNKADAEQVVERYKRHYGATPDPYSKDCLARGIPGATCQSPNCDC